MTATLAYWNRRRRRDTGLLVNPLDVFSPYLGFSSEDPRYTPPADGAAISTWRNGGSLGTAWDQSVAGSRPTYRASLSAFGGRPAMECEGTDDKVAILTGVSLAQPFSVVFLGVTDSLSAAQIPFGLHTGSISRGLRVSNTGQIAYNASGLVSAAGLITAGTPFLAIAYVDGAGSAIVLNGAIVALGNPGAFAVDQAIIGAGRSSGTTYGNPFDGKVDLAFVSSGNIFTHPSITLLASYARLRGVPL